MIIHKYTKYKLKSLYVKEELIPSQQFKQSEKGNNL